MCREEERRICGSGKRVPGRGQRTKEKSPPREQRGRGNGRRGDRMKVYTEKDLEGFERDDLGWLICPSGDYTQIKSFGERCSFGEVCNFGKECSFGEVCSFGDGCRFGEWCRFGKECSFGEVCSFGEGCSFERGRVSGGRYVAIDRIGSEKRKTYFFADRDGNIFVRAGCWFSDLSAFKERVRDVHAGTRHEKEYLAACDLAELMLMEEER